VVEIESERTTRDRELEMFGRVGPKPSSAQVHAQKKAAKPGHQALLNLLATLGLSSASATRNGTTSAGSGN
jgi:hypothetical protein